MSASAPLLGTHSHKALRSVRRISPSFAASAINDAAASAGIRLEARTKGVSVSVKAIIAGQPTSGGQSLGSRGVATALVVLLNTALIGGIIAAVFAIVSVTSATDFGFNSLR